MRTSLAVLCGFIACVAGMHPAYAINKNPYGQLITVTAQGCELKLSSESIQSLSGIIEYLNTEKNLCVIDGKKVLLLPTYGLNLTEPLNLPSNTSGLPMEIRGVPDPGTTGWPLSALQGTAQLFSKNPLCGITIHDNIRFSNIRFMSFPQAALCIAGNKVELSDVWISDANVGIDVQPSVTSGPKITTSHFLNANTGVYIVGEESLVNHNSFDYIAQTLVGADPKWKEEYPTPFITHTPEPTATGFTITISYGGPNGYPNVPLLGKIPNGKSFTAVPIAEDECVLHKEDAEIVCTVDNKNLTDVTEVAVAGVYLTKSGFAHTTPFSKFTPLPLTVTGPGNPPAPKDGQTGWIKTANGCEIQRALTEDEWKLLMTTSYYCKVGTPPQASKIIYWKEGLATQSVKLHAPLLIDNSQFDTALQINAPATTMMLFKPENNFSGSCGLAVGGGVKLTNIMVDGFTNNICVGGDKVTFQNVWTQNGGNGVFVAPNVTAGVNLSNSTFKNNQYSGVLMAGRNVALANETFTMNHAAAMTFIAPAKDDLPAPELTIWKDNPAVIALDGQWSSDHVASHLEFYRATAAQGFTGELLPLNNGVSCTLNANAKTFHCTIAKTAFNAKKYDAFAALMNYAGGGASAFSNLISAQGPIVPPPAPVVPAPPAVGDGDGNNPAGGDTGGVAPVDQPPPGDNPAVPGAGDPEIPTLETPPIIDTAVPLHKPSTSDAATTATTPGLSDTVTPGSGAVQPLVNPGPATDGGGGCTLIFTRR